MTEKQAGEQIWAQIQAGFTMAGSALAGFIVVPMLLFQLGMNFAGAYTSFAVLAIVSALLMGWLRLPVLLLPPVAVSNYLVYLVGISQGVSWQQLLGICFVVSVLSLLISVSPLRHRFFLAVPEAIRRLLPAGLGAMLILMGLTQGRIIVRSAWSVTMLGNFQDPLAYLGLTGIVVTLVMMAVRLRGALFWGMVVTAVISLMEGFWVIPVAPFMLPTGLDLTAGQLAMTAANEKVVGDMLAAGLTLLIVLTSMNWIVGQALIRESSNSRRLLPTTFAVGALGALIGSLPPAVSPLSAAGTLLRGGRRAAWSAALLFLVALFCEPLLAAMAEFPVMVVPVLVGTGLLLLLQTIEDLQQTPFAWDLPVLCAAACLLLVMPLANNITAGLGAALISWCVLRAAGHSWREVPRSTWALSILFAVYFVYAAI
ncbi:putative MFS transporter, AGZA family, xanthine/uracil permease [Selenomonas sp. GACV-9]|uniref:hypothetical protein n=1 Tax=Selenomonas sp. GACV-9 TaxID=3158782 RepID=UPI0008ECD8F6|nr:putative MFS transporter, AGZA family, xanthine/uracil permease [Selenomonas ruminantium]